MTDQTQSPAPGEADKRELLTESQAAELMGWSRQKIQRLRLAGKLPFYPGRPPLIEPADLEKLKVRRTVTPAETAVSPALAPPTPSAPTAQEETPEQRARRLWLRTRRR